MFVTKRVNFHFQSECENFRIFLSLRLDMHISRISRENEKWLCETFLARNPAARNCEKNSLISANLEPNLTKNWTIFKTKLLPFKNRVLLTIYITLFHLLITNIFYLFDQQFWENGMMEWKLKIWQDINGIGLYNSQQEIFTLRIAQIRSY